MPAQVFYAGWAASIASQYDVWLTESPQTTTDFMRRISFYQVTLAFSLTFLGAPSFSLSPAAFVQTYVNVECIF